MINPQHFDTAMLMLKHGKHVLCEKPMTMNLKQTTELINYARSKKLFLMEAVWSRCFPVYDMISKEIATGNIGDIHQVLVSFGFKMPDVDRLMCVKFIDCLALAYKSSVFNQLPIFLIYRLKKLGGGTILDLGIYCLQFASLIYNEYPENVKAAGFLNEDGVDVSMSATLTYKGNRTATIMTHGLAQLPNEAHICGTKGSIKVPNFWCPTMVELPSGTKTAPLPKLKYETNFINSAGLSYEAVEARDCILKGKSLMDLKTNENLNS